jgi:hypothetical protein
MKCANRYYIQQMQNQKGAKMSIKVELFIMFWWTYISSVFAWLIIFTVKIYVSAKSERGENVHLSGTHHYVPMNLYLINFCILFWYLPMRNIESTINSAFQCAKYFGTSWCTCKTNIKIASKWTFLTFDSFIFEFTTCNICCSFIYFIKFVFL